MSEDIERKCENSLTSQSQSTAGKKRKAPLQTINVGVRFNKFAADILGSVTKTKIGGYKYIIVLTDYFTKFVVSTSLQNTLFRPWQEQSWKNGFFCLGPQIQFTLTRAQTFAVTLSWNSASCSEWKKQRPRLTTLKATAWLSDTTRLLLMQFQNTVREIPTVGTRCSHI